MANILNVISCDESFKNVGWDGCKFDFKNIKAAYLVPLDFALTQTHLATSAALKAQLQALTLATAANRIYPIGEFVGVADSTEDPTYESLGYGGKKLSKEGRYMFKFRMDNGLFYHLKLRSFNNTGKYKIIFTDGSSIIGTQVYDTGTALWTLAGFTMSMFSAEKWKIDDGAGKSADYEVSIELSDAKEMNEGIGVILTDFDPSVEVKGLIDLEVVAGSTSASKIIYVKLLTKDTQINLYDEYHAELDAAAAWTVTVVSTGAAEVPSVVAAVPATKEFALTVANAVAYDITTVSPAALAALGVGGAPEIGYECTNTVRITAIN